MPNYRLAYQNVEGGVNIVIPAFLATQVAEMEILAQRMLQNKQLPEGIEIAVITTRDLPRNRHFRNAWAIDLVSRKVGTDMVKARDIHRNNLRNARTARLTELDVAYIRADEQNLQIEKAAIVQEKTTLRNLPNDPAIDQATTPEQLEALWPSSLPNPYKA